MPNQLQPAAATKPKAKKASAKKSPAPADESIPGQTAETPKATKTTKAAKTAKTTEPARPAKTPAGSEAKPKSPRKRASKGDTTAAVGSASAASPSNSAGIPFFYEVTHEMIAVRAYFLSENRNANGIPGDHGGDWHEAERQLRSEAAAIAASLRQNP